MSKVCLVVGAGDGVGGAIAKAFAAEGFTVAITRRERNLDQLQGLADEIERAGGNAVAYGVDARAEDEMIALFDRIEAEVGPLEVVVFNIGANVRFPLVETTSRVFSKVWEMACFAGFLTAREAARVMTPRGRGTILFTGATASMRGGKGYSAFAAAKVDGSIDGVFTRTNFPAEQVEAKLAADEILKPDEIAANYVWLHNQPRSAWTHELDLRPWKETW